MCDDYNLGSKLGCDRCGPCSGRLLWERVRDFVDPYRPDLVNFNPSDCALHDTGSRDDNQRHALDLPEGIGEPVTFEFEAPVPIENMFDIEIVMPIGTELDIKFLTSNGMTLMIFDPDKSGTSCVEDDGRLNCQLPYPALEAPTSGTWVATVDKISTPPAEVIITIEWRSVD